jgi:hypothetical protein
VEGVERFEIYVYVADGKEEEDLHRYVIEHWFSDKPEIETIAELFEEAKRDFSALYPDVEAENFDVEIRRLRPRDLVPTSPGASEVGS